MKFLPIPRRDWPWIAVYVLLFAGFVSYGVNAAKTTPLEEVVFIYTGNLLVEGRQVGVVRPIIAHDWAVALDSGNRAIAKGDVLHCKPKQRTTKFRDAQGPLTVTELLLVCKDPDRTLVVRGPLFGGVVGQ